MSEPADMIMPMLREMRPANRALHEATAERLALVERRLKKIEDAQVSYRQALTADSLMSKPNTGEFEERIESLERNASAIEVLQRRVRELEAEK